MWPVIASGVVFGLAAGLTPGPLFTLVVTQSLRYGPREGMKVAAAPLITDGPIIAVSVFVVGRLAEAEMVLGGLALFGAGVLAYLSYASVTATAPGQGGSLRPVPSLATGVVANLFNPHPYLFWLAVGGPTLGRAWDAGSAVAGGFLIAMYGSLVGSKALVAWAVGAGRSVFEHRAYVVLLRGLGVALGVFAAVFLRDALDYFGVI